MAPTVLVIRPRTTAQQRPSAFTPSSDAQPIATSRVSEETSVSSPTRIIFPASGVKSHRVSKVTSLPAPRREPRLLLEGGDREPAAHLEAHRVLDLGRKR